MRATTPATDAGRPSPVRPPEASYSLAMASRIFSFAARRPGQRAARTPTTPREHDEYHQLPHGIRAW